MSSPQPSHVASEKITVREALPTDLDLVVRFNLQLAKETEGKELDPETLRSGVQRALSEPGLLKYYLAERAGLTMGQAAVGYEWSDWRNGVFWWFQSVYVDTPFRSQGVFKTLFQHIRLQAHADPEVIGLRLYVEEHNHIAQNVYQSMGMSPGGYLVFEDLWGRSAAPPP